MQSSDDHALIRRRPRVKWTEFRNLHVFVAAVDTGSIVAAAKRIHLSPSAVTRRIQNLDETLKFKIQRSGKEGIVKTLDQPQQSRLGAPSRADSHGKPDGPPDRTGPLRRLRSVNARAARRPVLIAPIVLTGCQQAVLDPQGIVGLAQKMILIDSLAIMLAIVIPTIAATLAFAWWFRASNERARYLPDWAYSGRIELIVWGIPLLVIMLLGGVAWIGSHDLDPAKPLRSSMPPLEMQVVSLDWKWLFIYPSQGVASVNRLVVPAGVPIHFSLTSATVMNAFFIPQLGSMDLDLPRKSGEAFAQPDTSFSNWVGLR